MKYFSHEFEQASWWEDVNTTVYDFTNKRFWLFNIMQHLKNNNNEIIYMYVIYEYVTLVISKIIWNVYTVIKSCPYAFKGSKCLLWIKIWRFEPQNASENILQQFDHFEIYQDLYGKLLKLDCVARVVFPIQILLFFGSHCNDIQLKIYRFPNFNMLFQFLLTKFLKSELFSCSQKVDHVIN